MTLSPSQLDALDRRIAEVLGWTEIKAGWGFAPAPRFICYGKIKAPDPIPNFSRSLDAMAEAEKTLKHYAPYCIRLREIVWRDCGGESPRYESASASQRAIAFVRTHGALPWEETKS